MSSDLSTLTNQAAWQTGPKVQPLSIEPAALDPPGPSQILIRNHALAINPIDVKLADLAIYPINYPAILGQDVAGEVIAVGSELASKFPVGTRVMGMTSGFASKKETEKGFQTYTVLDVDAFCEIPDDLSYDRAVVLPLGISTAAAGLFQEEFLGLKIPTKPRSAQPGAEGALLIWGGASAVGSAAIQLAVAAGYEVFTTASAKNFESVKKLGASQVFDYKKEGVVDEIVNALRGKKLVGAFDAVGGPAWAASAEVVSRAEGAGGRKFVATATRGFKDLPEDVEMNQVFALSILKNGVGKAIWSGFLAEALKAGTFVPGVETVVVGKGLEHVQSGLNRLREGVSGQKIVVLL